MSRASNYGVKLTERKPEEVLSEKLVQVGGRVLRTS